MSLANAFHHLHRQFRFGLEAHRLRNARHLTPLGVCSPVPRKIEFPIDEGMTFGRDVGQKDAYLTVLNLPTGPSVLHFDAGRLAASLREAGLVNHHHGIVMAQLLQNIGTQVVTYQIDIPYGA